jgi:DNA (cytosine-5)-methyltransferase 1
MTVIPELMDAGLLEAPDVFCGGTPCQAFSVAGLRKSLDDARGNLSLVFCEIANAIDRQRQSAGLAPAIVFWENVPGVLSTKDNAFGCFLAGLAGEDDPLQPPGEKWQNAGAVLGPKRAVAWRVLDAQYFGVAQRRRRVFVVASARAGFDPASVLFEFDGVRRDSAPSREAGQVAPTIPSRSTAGGGLGTDFDCDGGLIPNTAQCLTTGSGKRYDPETETILPSFGIRTANTSSNGWGIQQEVSRTLDCANGVAVALPINTQIATRHEALGEGTGFGIGSETDPAFTLTKGHSHAVAHAIGWDEELNASTEQSGTPLRGGQGGRHDGVLTPAMQVRRLTPVECERLQGFPPGYTAIPWRKKPASECPDGPRYKALGNSWAVPVVRWIGQRISNAAH